MDFERYDGGGEEVEIELELGDGGRTAGVGF